METITQKDIANVVDGLLRAGEQELRDASESDLEQYWFFSWDISRSAEWNLYKFNDMLDLYRRQCRKWEEMHHGNCCVVERVRDKYLMPKIRAFLAELPTHNA